MLKLNNKEVVFETYGNGELCLKSAFIESLNIVDDINEVVWYYRGNDDFLKLLFLKSYLDECVPFSKFKLVITYLPFSRMDRRGEENYPFTLKYVCDYLNSLDFDSVDVIECHSEVGIELLENSSQVILNENLLEKVKAEICFNSETDFLVYPDKGAKQRYEGELGFGLHCDKVRDFQSGRISSLKLVEKDILLSETSKAIIVDDLCSYGNTFIMASNELKSLGFKEVYLLVCHSEDNIFKGDVLKDNNFNKVYTTNSILTSNNDWSNLKYKEKLEIFPI